MNPNKVKEILEYVKGSPENMDYGRWGALNPEQRKTIKELCNSWLILDETTNIQTKEIERIKELSKVDSQQAQEMINELDQENKRLHSIIKEVRECVETAISEDYYDGEIYKIKEILDKINKE